MAQRITTMAAATGLIAVLIGVVQTAPERVGAPGNNTSAFNATQALSQNFTELLPLGILMLALGAILYSTGILGG